MKTLTCSARDGHLTEAPAYTDHRRGKNWLATISRDPKGPGGIGRAFQGRGCGEYMYDASALAVGTPVEFGADYYTGSGGKRAERWYGVVVSASPDRVVFAQSTPMASIDKAGAIVREYLDAEMSANHEALAEALLS